MQLKVFTIAAHRPFLATLAAGLLGMAGADPLLLPRITVLLPTRRAVRSLREAFLYVAPDGKVAGTPLLLPRMRPIGDLDSGELSLPETSEEDLAVPPSIPELRRRLLLTRLVLHWGERRGEEPLFPGQAATLAASLARLLDRVATEGASFARIAGLVPEGLAEHWRAVHHFLEILPQHWPRILAEEGALDAASRRNRLLERQTATWRRSPPRHPVIAAGLIGGLPAMTELLSLIAALDQGAVVLPGLDRARDDTEWSAIEEDEAHPQHLMAGLLRALDLTPVEVRDWPPSGPDPIPACSFESLSDLPLFASSSRKAGDSAARSSESARARRVRLIAEALRPAVTTDAWRRLPAQPADTLDGLRRYDCASAQEEAVTIALLLRRKLETPAATAALVTPDRELARRVAAELRRWGIEIDDSAGLPLNRTPPGVFLRLVLDLAASRLAPVPLLAALKHPLASGGLAPVAFRDLARRLEQAILGPRPAPGFAGLGAALVGERVGLRRFAERLEACLGPLPELLVADAVPLSRLAAAHIEAAERLAATATETGGERLWHEAAGEAAARFCHELIEAARDFPPLPGRHYPPLFESLAAGAVVRPVFGRHPRLAIWGLVEARLQQADLIVLGGLNEGSWPPSAEHDPWMSRQMRREFGIALPERAIGIAAHDFAQAIGAPEVALTRAARSEGVPTVPSRWLLRLDTVLQAVGLNGALEPDETVRHAAEMIDRSDEDRPLPTPEPRPPLAARPRQLSVTQIETWLRDPYAIYARHILGLRPLDELDADPGRAELGTVIHRTLDAFFRRFPKGLPDDAEGELLRIGREQFGPILSRPGAWAFWWPRFERIASWLVNQERVRRAGTLESLSECEGSWTLPARGGPFTITAKADRIDRLATGGFLLVDYKTGGVPPPKEVQSGFAPQLPLEGAILRGGGFKGVSGVAAALEYWRLSGGDPAGERCPIDAGDPGGLIDRVLVRVEALIDRFDDPSTPYLAVPSPRWAPRFSDYRHLERLAESEAEE
ncbi:MAG TPA: double-strand break repair protein AddB [Stellaceae bacterium]|nr:double-strand break repair protein AddB [Stellaceae bacterium]